ncbi:MAG: hypothetical protein HN348_28360, partial [Proteobacteria bacterium]|nr:hypothetical protein [Pseudomonadota bacterium]
FIKYYSAMRKLDAMKEKEFGAENAEKKQKALEAHKNGKAKDLKVEAPSEREDALEHLSELMESKATEGAIKVLQGAMAIVSGVLSATGVGAPAAAALALANALVSLGKWLWGKWSAYKAAKGEARRMIAQKIVMSSGGSDEEKEFDKRNFDESDRNSEAKDLVDEYVTQGKKDIDTSTAQQKKQEDDDFNKKKASLGKDSKAISKAEDEKKSKKKQVEEGQKSSKKSLENVKTKTTWGSLSNDEKVEAAGRHDPFLFGKMSINDKELQEAKAALEKKGEARTKTSAAELVKDVDEKGGKMADAASFGESQREKLAKNEFSSDAKAPYWPKLTPKKKLELAEKQVKSLGGQ